MSPIGAQIVNSDFLNGVSKDGLESKYSHSSKEHLCCTSIHYKILQLHLKVDDVVGLGRGIINLIFELVSV